MLLATLGSGSAGNCTLFESEGTRILVDAGFGPRETEKRLNLLGISLDGVAAIVLTHEHYDHVRGAATIAKKYEIPIYATRGTLEGGRIDAQECRVVVFENNSTFRIGNLAVHARRTIHDAADPACFVIEASDGTRAGIASDLGVVDPPVLRHLAGCDALLFEANHDLDLLRGGSYPWSLKRRIMSNRGHLSNDDAMAAIRKMIGADLKALCLIHLSRTNNHESIVRPMAQGMIATTGAELDLLIAAQEHSIGRLEITRKVPRATLPRRAIFEQLSLFA